MNTDTGILLIIVIGVILLIALLLPFGGGMAMGGMAMMAGMMATPVGWIILLILLALAVLAGYIALYT